MLTLIAAAMAIIVLLLEIFSPQVAAVSGNFADPALQRVLEMSAAHFTSGCCCSA